MRRITRISVQNFRSYTALNLPLAGQSVVVTGANGAGKTNLLEAISFASPGRGMRRATLVDALRQGADPQLGWGTGIHLQDQDEVDPVALTIQATPPSPYRKAARVDGEPVANAQSLLEYVRFVWMTPAQDRLFMDGPSERRRFLDRMTMAHDPAHGLMAGRYEKAMRQRQACLVEPRRDEDVLTILEQQMAEAGVAIAAARRETASLLAAGYERLRSGAFPAAHLALDGEIEAALTSKATADVEDMFGTELRQSRGRDTEAGRALRGPHRTDLLVTHTEKNQPAKLCSTGEQKALLIGLILSQAAALKADAAVPLVLLLDEVAAHLDRARRAALADILVALDCQAFMTGTDSELFDAWGERAQHLQMVDGLPHSV